MLSGRQKKFTTTNKTFLFKSCFLVLFSVFSINALFFDNANAVISAKKENNKISIEDKTFELIEQNDNGVRYYVHRDGNSPKADVVIYSDGKYQLATFDIKEDKLLNKNVIDDVKIAENSNNDNEMITNCDIPVFGIVLCPFINQVSKSVDWLNSIIKDFMEVKPFIKNDDSNYIKYWKIVRNIANFTFIILLFIMIISHLTNIGISNYEVKKIFPKIIVYSLLVNLSFYLAALAIDLSNIFGKSIANIFINLSSNIETNLNWSELTGAAIGGGAVAGGMTIIGVSSGVGALTMALIPILLSALLSGLATFVALAVRQVLIISLAIVSPLALALNILPKTEKYWGKYLDLFKQLLLVFPIFEFLYGISFLISKTLMAGDNGEVNFISVLLALIIQLTPIFMLPKLLKSSNNLLSKAYEAVRNNKGTQGFENTVKSWSDRKKDYHANNYKAGKASNFNLPRKMNQAIDKRKRAVIAETERLKKDQDRLFTEKLANAKKGDGLLGGNSIYYKHKIMSETTTQGLSISESKLKEDLRTIINENSKKENGIYNSNDNSVEKKLAVVAMKKKVSEKAVEMADSTYATTYLNMIEGQKKEGDQIFDENGQNFDILTKSAGISGENGQSKLFADMLNAKKAGIKKHRDNAIATLEDRKIDFDSIWAIAKGQAKQEDFDFPIDNQFIREAAIEKSIKTGHLGFTTELINMAADDTNGLNSFSQLIGELTLTEGSKKAAFFYGKEAIDNIAKGQASANFFEQHALKLMSDVSKYQISQQDKDASDSIAQYIVNIKNNMKNISNQAFENKYNMNKQKAIQNIETYKKTIIETMNDPMINTISSKNAEKLNNILNS